MKHPYNCQLSIVFSILLLCSCNKETDYGVGEYRVDMVKVESDNSFSLLDKNETTLYNADAKKIQGIEPGNRILLNYSYLDQKQNGYDHVIKVNGASWVHCDSVRTIMSSLKDDPIYFESAWIGQNYLNMSFYIDQHTETHQIALIQTNTTNVSGNHYTHLELRHDNKDDSPGSRKKINASFDLSPLNLISGKDTIILKIQATYYYQIEEYILPY